MNNTHPIIERFWLRIEGLLTTNIDDLPSYEARAVIGMWREYLGGLKQRPERETE